MSRIGTLRAEALAFSNICRSCSEQRRIDVTSRFVSLPSLTFFANHLLEHTFVLPSVHVGAAAQT
jgi:hypothetical protein